MLQNTGEKHDCLNAYWSCSTWHWIGQLKVSSILEAEISVRLHRKVFIFIIWINLFWSKISQKKGLILKTEALLMMCYWIADSGYCAFDYISLNGLCVSPSCTTLACVHGTTPMVYFRPKYWLNHPQKQLFSLSIKILSGSKYPEILLCTFENRSTVRNQSLLQLKYNLADVSASHT